VMSKGVEEASQGSELGARAARSGMKRRRCGRLEQRGEEEFVLTSGARMSVRKKRQGAKAKDTNPKGKCIRKNTPMAHEPSGPAEEATTCGMDGPA
jgi:hypothetical protein